MTTVKKGNVELTVDETEVTKYLADGYDQIDGSGAVVKQATGGKTVSIAEYNKLLAENEELKKKLAATDKSGKKKQTSDDETDEAAAE